MACHLQMNVRSLCFARVARDFGESWLWWEYADKIGADCSISKKLYNPDCSEKVSCDRLLQHQTFAEGTPQLQVLCGPARCRHHSHISLYAVQSNSIGAAT